RAQGLQVDDPDPDPNAGRTKPKIHTDGVPQAKVDAALAACRRYNPNFGQPARPDPAEQERMYQFRNCMREKGIEPPDAPEGALAPAPPPPQQRPTPSEDFDKAVRECSQKVPGVASLNPSPGTKQAR